MSHEAHLRVNGITKYLKPARVDLLHFRLSCFLPLRADRQGFVRDVLLGSSRKGLSWLSQASKQGTAEVLQAHLRPMCRFREMPDQTTIAGVA